MIGAPPPADVFGSASEGGGGPLPYASEMSAAFGIDASAIPAYVGQQGPMAALGAHAATDGSSIAFADTAPDRHTVAHEVAHVVQGERGAGIQAKSVSTPGASSEVDADRAANAVVAGQSPEVAATPSAGIQLDPDPATYSPAAGFNSVHTAPTLGDTFSSTPGAAVPAGSAPAATGTQMTVEIGHGGTNPIRLPVGTPPPEQDLYRVLNTDPTCTPGGPGVEVISRVGSVSAPVVAPDIDPTTMYIANTPTMDDIQQNGIGDCWLLAALSNIVGRDPNRIRSSMTFTGGPAGTASMTLYRYDNTSVPPRYVPVTITTANTLLHYQEAANPAARYGLVGAGARRADRPIAAEWLATADAGVLTVTRRDLYEVALWAPLLEKIYATFTAQWGQYGGAPARDPEQGGATGVGSGYEQINGGWEDQAYGVFYGQAMQSHNQEAIAYTPNTNPVLANEGAIANLLRVMGQGVAPGQTFMMSCDLDQGSAVDRLIALITFITGDRDCNKYPSLKAELLRMVVDANAYKTAAPGAPETAAMNRLAARAEHSANPRAWPLLTYNSSLPRYHELFELLNTIKSLGTDHSPGQRATYADHAYPVLGASFVDTTGAAMALTQPTLHAQLANIDPAGSRVTMRNPHHTNEPNLPTSLSDANTEDGVFQMSLDQYLRSFALQEVATVTSTPAPAPPP